MEPRPTSSTSKDERSLFASRSELNEATSSRWFCAGDSFWQPPAPESAWPVRSSSLTSWLDCSSACRRTICPRSLASPLYLPLSRSPPVMSRRCAPCASIQSLHSAPNDFLAAGGPYLPAVGKCGPLTTHQIDNPLGSE